MSVRDSMLLLIPAARWLTARTSASRRREVARFDAIAQAKARGCFVHFIAPTRPGILTRGGGRHTAAKCEHQTNAPTLSLLRATMTSRSYTTSQHYTTATEPQATTRVNENVRRMVDARDDPSAPQLDAAALTAALSLEVKPVLSGVARKVAATYAIPYDSLMARRRRAALAE
jgi:hypothetical protein